MIYRFIGDVHGRYALYSTILKNSPYPTINVGDMGVGFFSIHGEAQANPPYDKMVEGNHRFIRGNHDNPKVCKNNTQWISDGTMETTENGTKIMYVGGAWSIDWEQRIEGINWWRDEELTSEEFDKIVFDYVTFMPDVMVTHDCPSSVAYKLFLEGTRNPVYTTRTGQALEAMLSLHKPKLHCFGHWHSSRNEFMDGVRYICLGELETMDIEL